MSEGISVYDVHPNPNQPRKTFDDEAIGELATSIADQGLLQPITVRPRQAGGYEIVCGECRWRAHKRLVESGRSEFAVIAAQVRDMSDHDMAVAAFIENLQRRNVSPLEESDALRAMRKQGIDVFTVLGIPEAKVKRLLRLQHLLPEIRKLVEAGHVTPGAAFEIARLRGDNQRAQMDVIRLMREGSVSNDRQVKQAVDAIEEKLSQTDIFGPGNRVTIDERHTVDSMERRIEAIIRTLNGGWKDGECVLAAKVDRNRAGKMAEQLKLLRTTIAHMERALDAVLVRSAAAVDDTPCQSVEVYDLAKARARRVA